MVCGQAVCVEWMRKATEGSCMKTISETRPGNVTPFVLEGCWALDGLDQSTMR
jgi:hypothetical protein